MKRNCVGLSVIYCLIFLGVLTLTGAMSQVATVMVENAPRPAGRCILIDPGHGGEDGGAVSLSGIAESQYNLEISLRLEQVFRLLGYQTHMLRREDRDLHLEGDTVAARKASDLRERVRQIGLWEDPLLISIHQNYFPQTRYAGPQVFYPGTQGSEELGKHLQQLLNRQLLPESSRQAKPAQGIYLMEHIQCQGLLVECGFLSNPREEALLRDPEYQKHLCCVIAAGICAYFEA